MWRRPSACTRARPRLPAGGVPGALGSVERAVVTGLALRYDGGSCSRSRNDQTEIDHLGIERSPAYHYEPETNGCVEKSIQMHKEQLCQAGSRARCPDARAPLSG